MSDTIAIADGLLRPAAHALHGTETLIPSPCVQNHAANLLPLENGDVLCVWFGGTQEGIADISIWCARLKNGADRWGEAVKLSEDATRSEQNPVLFPAPDGKLHLFWTAQVSGRQDTAIVRHRVSDDQGLTWGLIETAIDVPGTFIRQPLVVRGDGAWLMPLFLCRTEPGIAWVGDNDISAVAISSDQGRTWRRVEVPGSLGAVHMNIVQLDPAARDAGGKPVSTFPHPARGGDRLVAFYRSRWADHVRVSRSDDGGETWTSADNLPLPNNNSSIQVTRLADGRLAMVHNWSSKLNATERRLSLYDEIEDPEAGEIREVSAGDDRPSAFWGAPRAPMTLSVSSDGGYTWPVRVDLEEGDGYCLSNNSRESLNRELSYPSIAQAPDGTIHVAYTWFRKAIKHMAFRLP